MNRRLVEREGGIVQQIFCLFKGDFYYHLSVLTCFFTVIRYLFPLHTEHVEFPAASTAGHPKEGNNADLVPTHCTHLPGSLQSTFSCRLQGTVPIILLGLAQCQCVPRGHSCGHWGHNGAPRAHGWTSNATWTSGRRDIIKAHFPNARVHSCTHVQTYAHFTRESVASLQNWTSECHLNNFKKQIK